MDKSLIRQAIIVHLCPKNRQELNLYMGIVDALREVNLPRRSPLLLPPGEPGQMPQASGGDGGVRQRRAA
jgi:hypothetical protein